MLETFVIFVGVAFLVFGTVLAELLEGDLRVVVIVTAYLTFFVSMITVIYIDYKGGKYKCEKCGEEFTPSVLAYIFSPHFGTTRHLRCPACNEKSWCKRKRKD